MVHRLWQLTVGRARRARTEQHGVVMVVLLIMMTVAIGLAAIVVDLGNARQEDRQAEASADAAALAAAQRMEDYGANFTGTGAQWADIVNVVKTYTNNNFGIAFSRWAGCGDPHPLAYRPDTGNGDNCISADFSAWPATQNGETSRTFRIKVRLPEDSIPTAFGAALGHDRLQVNAEATSGVIRATSQITTTEEDQVAGGPCAICVLGGGLSLDGQNGDISVTGGNVIVDSTAPTGAQLMPNGHIRVKNGGQIGGPGAPGNFSGSGYSPSPTTLAPVPDPLAAVPACGTGSTCPTTTGNSGSTLNPGIYSSISGSHTLNPGIYVLKGDITLNGNDLLVGNGVMLYFACSSYPNPCSSSGQAGARIKATGNGSMRVTPPTAAQCTTNVKVCPYVGMSIFADRNNTSTQTYRGNGTNENGLTSGGAGTFYMRSGTLDLRGNGYTLSSMIVVKFLTMNGNPSGITVAYDQSRNIPLTHTESHSSTSTAVSYDASGLLG